MTHRLLLGVIVAAAIGIVVVSLVPGWVVHVRLGWPRAEGERLCADGARAADLTTGTWEPAR